MVVRVMGWAMRLGKIEKLGLRGFWVRMLACC